MKKNMLIILAASVFLITSCSKDDDGYSLGKFWIGFGIVQNTDSTTDNYRITMDNKKILIPVSVDFNIYDYVKDGDRIRVNYTILDDNANGNEPATEYYVRINSVSKILMKGIIDITEENQDSIGNNPVDVKDIWVSDNLLNIEILYWGSNKTHFINIVKQPGELNENTAQPIEIELRHNNNNDEEIIPQTGFVSFQLNALKIPNIDSVEFVVKGTNYSGKEFNYKGVYNYNN
ncbi:MAG: NigD-like protein [Bacteroidales bacterium]|jgi:major membrane immunogen (membrane-anchored lipoprotein)|nr:NigD-like protein [Bacteroidales bacterium]